MSTELVRLKIKNLITKKKWPPKISSSFQRKKKDFIRSKKKLKIDLVASLQSSLLSKWMLHWPQERSLLAKDGETKTFSSSYNNVIVEYIKKGMTRIYI